MLLPVSACPNKKSVPDLYLHAGTALRSWQQVTSWYNTLIWTKVGDRLFFWASRLALLGKPAVQRVRKERTNLFWVKVKSGG